MLLPWISLNHFFLYFGYKKKFVPIASEKKNATHNVIEKSIILSLHSVAIAQPTFTQPHTYTHTHPFANTFTILMSLTKKFVCTEHSILDYAADWFAPLRTHNSDYNINSISTPIVDRVSIGCFGADKIKERKELIFSSHPYVRTTQSRQSILSYSHQVNSQFLTNCATSDVSLYIRAWFWVFIFRAVGAFPCNSH